MKKFTLTAALILGLGFMFNSSAQSNERADITTKVVVVETPKTYPHKKAKVCKKNRVRKNCKAAKIHTNRKVRRTAVAIRR